jgi:hypothetical protein
MEALINSASNDINNNKQTIYKMNSLEEIVVVEPVVVKTKKPRVKKPKHVSLPVVEELVPEPEPVSLPPVPEPEPEPVQCEACGEPIVFTDEEMDIYRRVCAFKRKQLRLRKGAVFNPPAPPAV